MQPKNVKPEMRERKLRSGIIGKGLYSNKA